jgi:hypothetical protein
MASPGGRRKNKAAFRYRLLVELAFDLVANSGIVRMCCR